MAQSDLAQILFALSLRAALGLSADDAIAPVTI
jgi:hypothetical protein